MIRKLTQLSGVFILGAALASPIHAQPTNHAAGPEHKESTRAARQYPFHGKLAQVDKVQKTISLAGKEKSRTIQITSKTKITRAGKPAILDQAVIGEEVAGLAVKVDKEVKEVAVSLRLGAKSEKAGAKKRKSSEP